MGENTALKLETSWPEVKERIKEANSQLTDQDLDYKTGNEESLLLNLSKKLNMGSEEVRAWIESLSSNKGKAS